MISYDIAGARGSRLPARYDGAAAAARATSGKPRFSSHADKNRRIRFGQRKGLPAHSHRHHFRQARPGREAEARPAARGLRRERQHAARAAEPARLRRAGRRRGAARVRGRAGLGRESARDRGAAAAARVPRARRNHSTPATWTGRGASSPPITSSRRSRSGCWPATAPIPKPGSATTGNSITR